jgi:GntR family transcriptional repressor for pyruvate dehydrogenase complex
VSGRTAPVVSARSNVTDRLISAFKQLISEGALKAGSKLPPERDLASSFGVARSSLRQALKVLEIMGVISQRVGDGTYVNAAASSILSEPMEFLILLDGISTSELMEARLIVEPELAAHAAERALPSDIAEIRLELRNMEASASDLPRFITHDLAFHQSIFRASGNRVCTLMFSIVHELLGKLMTVTSRLVNPEHTLKLHKRIYTAIAKGDVAMARRRMQEHLRDAQHLLTENAAEEAKSRLSARIGSISNRKVPQLERRV